MCVAGLRQRRSTFRILRLVFSGCRCACRELTVLLPGLTGLVSLSRASRIAPGWSVVSLPWLERRLEGAAHRVEVPADWRRRPSVPRHCALRKGSRRPFQPLFLLATVAAAFDE